MAKRKLDARAFAQQKRKRRQWLTFVRMCRYGINNFSRNAWLTVAATAVMTITLLIIFATFVAHNVLTDSVTAIRSKVDMAIYTKTDANQADITATMNKLRKLSTVRKVSYTSPDQAQQQFAKQNATDQATLNSLNEATNLFPGTIHINLVDINDTTQLKNFVDKDSVTQRIIDENRPPSYAGSLKKAIENIGHWTDFAQKFGLVAGILFIAISSLIIFNTIRMAIFNRKDEIQMMKLIGADRNFIRGPFIVEAIVYGFIAALVATAIGIGILLAIQPKLIAAGIAVGGTVNLLTRYIGIMLLIMIVIGGVIGVASSLLATRRYLKI